MKTRRTNPPWLMKTRQTNPPWLVKTRQTNPPWLGENATNEPTVARENATNEPTEVTDVVVKAASCAGTDDRDEKNFEEGFSVQESESIRKGCEKIRLARAEQLRKLNEEARREAEAAMAIRRSRLREQKDQNGKPAGQPEARSTHTGQTSKEETAALNMTELEQFVKTALADWKGGSPIF